jgi:hypothetical protein
MKKLCTVLLVLVLSSAVCLGATETLRNASGKTATGVTVTFSEEVRITSYDTAVFPNQDPTGRSDSFTFSGGELANRGGFRLNWTSSSASIESFEWQVPAHRSAMPTGISDSVAWSQVPYIFTYSEAPPIKFYCDGDTDFANAQFWGRPGRLVKGFKVEVLEDALLVGVDLHESDQTGVYRYIIGLGYGSKSSVLYVFLDPQGRGAEVAIDSDGKWTSIAWVSDSNFGQTASSVFALLPEDIWLEYASHEDLVSGTAFFHIDYIESDRRELFLFEGHGPPTIPGATQPLLSVSTEIPGLEYLGNPFAARLPEGSGLEAARTVWDMQVFGERVYLGHGSARSNTGPTPVWYWDCATETFVQEFTVDDEEIRWFGVFGDEMLVPGIDATESWDFGNIYTFDGSTWTKLRTLPHAIHVYTVRRFDGDLFAIAPPEGAPTQTLRSSDDGQTWTEVYSDPDNATQQLFEFDGHLYLDSVWAGPGNQALVWDGQAFAAVEGVELFPGGLVYVSEYEGVTSRTTYGMRQFESFGTDLVYIGRSAYYKTNSSVYALHEMSAAGVERLSIGKTSDLTSTIHEDGSVTVQGEEAYDVVVEGDACWVLTNELHEDDTAATVRVYTSKDLVTWTKALEFESPTIAFSFEVHGGYIYFGLGAAHPHRTNGYSRFGENYPTAGRIYRYALP